tara:strand:+ start:49 stop:780 length:732 start_codon:yes stop_codon:yes gene_type:complete
MLDLCGNAGILSYINGVNELKIEVMRKITNILLLGFIITFQVSCKKQDIKADICTDGCESYFYIDPLSSPDTYLDENGFHHVKHIELNYFTIKGVLEEVIEGNEINGVPNVEVGFDSDYWITFNNIHFTTPMYNGFLGWHNDGDLNTPISMGEYEYTLEDLSNRSSIFNIVGYEITKYMCLDCPYTPTLVGTYSKYTYEPQMSIFFDDEMIGDTTNIYIEVKHRGNSTYRSSIKEHAIRVIFE